MIMVSGLLTYGSIAIIVVSTLIYHVAQKSTPSDINPLISLIVTYVTSLVICVVAYILFQNGNNFIDEVKKTNWAIVVLGLSIVGIEFGFLVAYRSGWNISKANLFASSIIVILLIPIGLAFFNEKISLLNIVGIICCIVGVGLIGQ
ncbi:membrane protein [Helicovermis profundi]|uniref:Membrane protein n=2 Tax=Helicovermis profundi TaxID=3065157 RepID=A0AAU9ED17_9FIRM|nr:membrane protein [Clostridia bacterium S502]